MSSISHYAAPCTTHKMSALVLITLVSHLRLYCSFHHYQSTFCDSTSVDCTRLLQCPHTNNSIVFRSGECAGRATGPTRQIHVCGNILLLHSRAWWLKCAGASSCKTIHGHVWLMESHPHVAAILSAWTANRQHVWDELAKCRYHSYRLRAAYLVPRQMGQSLQPHISATQRFLAKLKMTFGPQMLLTIHHLKERTHCWNTLYNFATSFNNVRINLSIPSPTWKVL
jgi:hypothetical protein